VPDFFQNPSQLVVRIFCALGLASVVCSLVFMACWLWYRGTLNRLHEESRRFIMEILESQSRLNRAHLQSPDSVEATPLSGDGGIASRSDPARYVSYWDLFSSRKAS
jgi:hypothetical protein